MAVTTFVEYVNWTRVQFPPTPQRSIMEDDFMFESEEEMMDYLSSHGALELHGMTQDGEITYKFNFEILKEVLPQLHELMMSDMEEEIMELYNKGYVEMEYDENLNARFRLTEAGIKYLEENGMGFPEL